MAPQRRWQSSAQQRRLRGNVDGDGKMRWARSGQEHRSVELQQWADSPCFGDCRNSARREPSGVFANYKSAQIDQVLQRTKYCDHGFLSTRTSKCIRSHTGLHVWRTCQTYRRQIPEDNGSNRTQIFGKWKFGSNLPNQISKPGKQ